MFPVFCSTSRIFVGRACTAKACNTDNLTLGAGNFLADRASNFGLPADIVDLSSSSPDAAIRPIT
jgi:hypothetical protein